MPLGVQAVMGQRKKPRLTPRGQDKQATCPAVTRGIGAAPLTFFFYFTLLHPSMPLSMFPLARQGRRIQTLRIEGSAPCGHPQESGSGA